MERKETVKKVFGIIGNVIIWIIAIFALFAVFVTVGAKKSDDGAATIFGYQLRFVETGSMEKSEYTDVSGFKIKSIPIRSCVFVRVAPSDDAKKAEWYASLKVGDVLTFRYSYGASQPTITHRIVEIAEDEAGGYVFTLKGDNPASDDPASVGTQVIRTRDEVGSTFNYIIGKVTGQSYLLGLTVYALRQPVGIVLIVIVPCLIVIALQIARIASVFGKEKEEKRKEEIASRENEIEELKRKLEKLQSNSADSETNDDKI